LTLDEMVAKRKADISESERAQRAYLAKLAEGTKAEATNEAWAGKKSAEFRASFTAAGFRRESLRSLECKSTLCSAEIALSPELTSDGKSPVDSVVQWLSGTEPCAFTVAPAEGAAGKEVAIQVYINCGMPAEAKPAQ
jgi:hypothetical protein